MVLPDLTQPLILDRHFAFSINQTACTWKTQGTNNHANTKFLRLCELKGKQEYLWTKITTLSIQKYQTKD
jgi:hypothetical protein